MNINIDQVKNLPLNPVDYSEILIDSDFIHQNLLTHYHPFRSSTLGAIDLELKGELGVKTLLTEDYYYRVIYYQNNPTIITTFYRGIEGYYPELFSVIDKMGLFSLLRRVFYCLADELLGEAYEQLFTSNG